MKPAGRGLRDEDDGAKRHPVARAEHRRDADDQGEVVVEPGEHGTAARPSRAPSDERDEEAPTPPPATVAAVATMRRSMTVRMIHAAWFGWSAHVIAP